MDIANSKTKLWKENIEKLLFKGNVCGICLSVEEELDNLNTVYYTEGGKKEKTLKEILGFTFGVHIVSQLPTHCFCEPCVTAILQSYFMVKEIRSNYSILQKYIDILTQQAKISPTTEQPVEKQLLLTIDNVKGLNVPGTVTKKDKENKFTQIFLCEVDASDDAKPKFDFENSQKKYECPYCGKQYEEFSIFKDHYSLHNQIYFRCHKCSKRYKYFKELIEHRNQKHLDDITSCNVCQIILLNPNSKEHELQHTNNTSVHTEEVDASDDAEPKFDFDNSQEKYECPYCGKQYEEFSIFKDHYSLHNETYFRCHKCSKRYKYFKELIEHRNQKHFDGLTSCNVCQIILLNPNSKEHELQHTNHTCVICEINFQKQDDFEMHNEENHMYVSCVKCLKSFSNVMKLKHHRCPYKCSECQDKCVHERYLESYKQMHMAKASVFRCPDCDFIYTAKCQIILHANEKHLNHLPFLCDSCGESFAAHPLLTAHIYKQHDNVSLSEGACEVEGPVKISSVSIKREYEHDTCGSSFNSEESYTAHRQNHETNDTQCQICDRVFISIGQLNAHVKSIHTEENPFRNITYRCTMCPLDFKLRTELLKHIPTHPKGTPHTCRKCNESFLSKKSYLLHVRKHRLKSCPICFKKYTNNSFSRHLRSHLDPDLTPESAIVCDVCSSILPSEKDLIKHADTHTDQRQCPHCMKPVNSVLYAKHISYHSMKDNMKDNMKAKNKVQNCSDCNYTTKFAVCLEAHVNRYHLKIRPYVCDLCNKTFYTDDTLKEHKKTHKEERPEHYCYICDKKFISQKVVRIHTRIHTGEQPYPCDLCELSFISASRRQQHKIRKHSEPQIECQICFKKLYTQTDLKRHIGVSHAGESKRKKTKRVEQDLNM